MAAKAIFKKVWGIWPSLDAMALALDCSAVELREARDAGQLPDARLDPALVLYSRAVKGMSLSFVSLEKARNDLANAKQMKVEKKERSQVIADFYAACGGVEAVARITGISETALYINKNRGYLPRARRYEFEHVAKMHKQELDPAIFDRIE